MRYQKRFVEADKFGLKSIGQTLIHVGDWNEEDKVYRVAIDYLKSMKDKILAMKGGMEQNRIWQDFIKNAKRVETTADRLEFAEYFLDWSDMKGSVKEWEL